MPHCDAFRDDASYVAILSHELTHNAAIRIMPRLFKNPWLAG
jgi:antirestriction protein ArdC